MSDEAIRQAVILVGGKGTRLGEITRDTPKPLLPIADSRSFLDYLLEAVERHGYEDILLLAGYLADKVESIYQGRRVGEARVRVLRERAPLGTAGALTLARDQLEDRFLMLNGDALFDVNLRALECKARVSGAVATLALRAVPDAARYGRVIVEDGRVVAFLEKDMSRPGPGVISGGIYVLRREILDLIDEPPCSIEQDIFPLLVERGEVVGELFSGYFLDIGLPETLEQGRRELPLIRRRPAAFLDRDGVINIDQGYTYKPEDLRFISGAPQAIRRLNDLGRYVFVATNQAGVARGFYGLDEVRRFHAELRRRLALEGAHVDRFYVAPYHPEGIVPEFAIDHFERKPNPGMLLKAMQEWPIVKERSFVIGDRVSDTEAARRVGLRGYLFGGGDLDEFLKVILEKEPPSV